MIVYYSLFIQARFCSEVVERILRVTRHRGFELCALNTIVYNIDNNKQITLFLTVSSEKAIYLLCTQLNKLVDIQYIEVR
ncbi:putative acetolactate synthase isozyme 2 small subunit [Candidatus Blochmanniella vafra str. BVAF]|uniref:Acetolactate synthase isozyme 2 small subunit n=1 Tax=Blochmanniella vafra (strain BVAF) TaxID=859654 RepID=E8Q6J9_BLOVB|nr:acetolactate synthase 2 small subunit [Candidatus Blochmannia vafer]ADV33968.1 putative acetolactate synthase isozyme 2 small subunit [Candidatus Blochmannia vafer str. BVAF]